MPEIDENQKTNPEEQGKETQETQETNQQEKKLSYEELQAELKKVRQEAASRRIANREKETELEEAARKWREYEESQKTELQKLQEALAERDKKLTDYQLKEVKFGLIDEFGLEKDDLDLLTGLDEASNRKIAERLKAKNEKIASATSSRPADLLAGSRGSPVGSSNDNKNFDDMLRAMARGRQ